MDPRTCLFTRTGVWDYHNAAADYYSSLVLMAHYVRPELLAPGAPLHQTLLTNRRLLGTNGLPQLYDVRDQTVVRAARLTELSEWLRDGLLRISEILGTDNDWYREMERLTDAMLEEAEGQGGVIKAFPGPAAAGEMLQTLARLHAMSGRPRYIEAAEILADYYLLAPRDRIGPARFTDHGCELIPGLAEVFAIGSQTGRTQADKYARPLRELLDELLANSVHPQTGLFVETALAAKDFEQWPLPSDTWGYVLYAYENFERATGEICYRRAIERPLHWLVANRDRYAELKASRWPRSSSSDDWSDSYESFLLLWNRYPIAGGWEWLDWATRQHIHRRDPAALYGPYTGGHFDGSTGRTLCLHMMLAAQGVRTAPFNEGLRLGGIRQGDAILLTVESATPWSGRLIFDCRARTIHQAGTLDWARLNEMPQWFAVESEADYDVCIDGQPCLPASGRQLADGWELAVTPGEVRQVRVALRRAEGEGVRQEDSPGSL